MITDAEVEVEERGTIAVRLRDDDHPQLQIHFTYSPGLTGDLGLVGYSVGPAPGSRGRDLRSFATFTEAQRLPWKRWEQAARSKVAADRREGAEDLALVDLVTRLATQHPDLALADPRMDAALHLARVAAEYRTNVAAGLRSPAAEIARSHGVRPETARAWISRARKAGFLGPAVGPTPGEAAAKPSTKTPTTTAKTTKAKATKGKR